MIGALRRVRGCRPGAAEETIGGRAGPAGVAVRHPELGATDLDGRCAITSHCCSKTYGVTREFLVAQAYIWRANTREDTVGALLAEDWPGPDKQSLPTYLPTYLPIFVFHLYHTRIQFNQALPSETSSTYFLASNIFTQSGV